MNMQRLAVIVNPKGGRKRGLRVLESVKPIFTNAGIELKIPENHESRVEMLKEMIRLMACDGQLSKPEKDLCARASSQMDFTTGQFKAIVNELIGDRDE